MMSKGYCSGGNPWYGVVFFLLILADGPLVLDWEVERICELNAALRAPAGGQAEPSSHFQQPLNVVRPSRRG